MTDSFRSDNKECTPARAAAIALACVALGACSTINSPDGKLSSASSSLSLQDADVISQRDKFKKHIYASVGLGASRLEPETSANSIWNVNDRVVPAGQITVGTDLTKTISVEVHSADLGSAGMSPQGRINYHMNGASALLYAGPNRKQRSGFSSYGRLGVARMDNSAVGDVDFTQINDTQMMVGAGAEYGWRNGFGMRGEIILFDTDAQFAQLGVVYRLGGSDDNLIPVLAEIPAESTPVFKEPLEPSAVQEVAASSQSTVAAPIDDDQDGIANLLDSCLATPVGIAVDESGCAIFNGIIDGINFQPSSARLTASAQGILDNVVDTLSQRTNVLLSIGAHTDAQGDSESNMRLSRNRAISVAKYLIINGVPKEVLSARAFGELTPLADNSTSEGRAQNRRVELVASQLPVRQ